MRMRKTCWVWTLFTTMFMISCCFYSGDSYYYSTDFYFSINTYHAAPGGEITINTNVQTFLILMNIQGGRLL